MCGIIGYTGVKPALPRLLEGLGILEYRGYDSSGIALLGDTVRRERAKGKLAALIQKVENFSRGEDCGIGHTRWATHGAPTEDNAHPHTDEEGSVAVVHNGIIENYKSLKEGLLERGISFTSQTDSEVIPHLLAMYRRQGAGPLEAISRLYEVLEGSFALGIVFRDRPGRVYGIRRGSPLLAAHKNGESFLASDIPALSGRLCSVYYLEEGEIACLTKHEVAVFDRRGVYLERYPKPVSHEAKQEGKGEFSTYMEKEIHEAPGAVEATFQKGGAPFYEDCRQVYLVGCGSAYHACLVGELLLERYRGVSVKTMVASEFRYRNVPLSKDTPVILVSQSGETADTLAAMREAKKKGAPTYAICNVRNSAMSRETDREYPTMAGIEVAVATTKAYAAQLAAFYRLVLGEEMTTKVVNSMEDAIRVDLGQIVPYLTARAHAFYIGRGIDDAICKEGSLKLKEISYLHAEAYAGGELKHGTISLIEPGTPVIAVMTDPALFEKTRSGVDEVLARGAKVWLLCPPNTPQHLLAGCTPILLPDVPYPYTPFPAAIVLERIALGVAKARGYDPDRPRNLAKSVTVE